ncbi:MAG: hypothetical protein MJ203_00010 [archaeon]|nr:hypothetical protein [archaeon]
MQPNLNDTISHLNYLIGMINKHCINNDNLKASNVVVNPKVVDVPKLLGDCSEAITENPVLKQFVKNFEDSVNRLNPLNARPEIKEYLTLGIDRNLRKVAKNTGRSLKYIKKLSAEWNWTERANLHDTSVVEENKKLFEAETNEKYLKANRLAIRSIDFG